MLNNMRHSFVSSLIESKYQSIDEFGDMLGLGSQALPSLKSVMKEEKGEAHGSQIAAAGIVRLNFTTPSSV